MSWAIGQTGLAFLLHLFLLLSSQLTSDVPSWTVHSLTTQPYQAIGFVPVALSAKPSLFLLVVVSVATQSRFPGRNRSACLLRFLLRRWWKVSPGPCRLSKGGWLSRQPPPWAWLISASVLCPRCLTGSAEWKLLVVLVPFSGWVCFPHFVPGAIL